MAIEDSTLSLIGTDMQVEKATSFLASLECVKETTT